MLYSRCTLASIQGHATSWDKTGQFGNAVIKICCSHHLGHHRNSCIGFLTHEACHVLAAAKLRVAIKETTSQHAWDLGVAWNGNADHFTATLVLAFDASRR